ncbi:MAG: aspartate-semialdehyde dehydrogenase [Candidatus Diapherotrites archaeon]|uniref:Aspartate-semialdehyde dehydrogenase n=1 Tax=Candidatus Iainarchaeum sp. TaxID=3101447 RepID=A0A939C441_9ARCH|nr:aspartate-semialdehyde dehydrogenase [Candidatus Diapherotrites archaeon]
MKKTKVAVLGATGMVGQRFLALLENNPYFEVSALCASERSAGKEYREAVSGRWAVEGEIPEKFAEMPVEKCEPGIDAEIVFGALDSSIAEPIEQAFAKEGYAVSSNTRCHRMCEDIPLVIPEVNAGHLEIIEEQKKNRKWGGFIVTNPNCSTIAMVLGLHPLQKAFGLEKISVTTMQALSGAGYPGVSSLDILDNVIPHIGGEEGKMESEPLKIWGELKGGKFENADMKISAHCNRVNVKDGHLETISLSLKKKASLDEVKKALKEFRAEPQELNLPSAPKQPVILMEEENRPQPRLDRMLEKGMASVVGRIREDKIFDYKMLILGHNTIRGAAGCAILNAELLKAKKYI